jgi:hypothetical protein
LKEPGLHHGTEEFEGKKMGVKSEDGVERLARETAG